MAYIAISDFKFGMDRRRPRIAGVPGTLYTLKNAHLTRGGDVERPKKFVSKFVLPGGTHSLARIREQLYVFGSADLAGAMPLGISYQRLQSPTGAAMARVLDIKAFSGKLYVVAVYADGHIHHFYDGARVTDWDAIGTANSTVTTLAEYLASKINSSPVVRARASSANAVTVEARTPGVPFTVALSTLNGAGTNNQTFVNTVVRPNVVPVAEVRAQGKFTITGGTFDVEENRIVQVTVNGVALLALPVHWRQSHSATAVAVAQAINNQTSTHTYTAVADGADVNIRAPVGAGAAANGRVVAGTTSGDVTATTSNFVGGVTAVQAVAQMNTFTFGGTYEADDKFTATIDGLDYVVRGQASGTGVSAFTYKQREWSVAGTQFMGSKLNAPSNWSDTNVNTGAITVDASNESEGAERLIGMGSYSSYAAVFSRSQIRLYTVTTDAAELSFYQTLDNTGTVAARSILSYGNNDVFYLDPSGIRSIRARDVLNAAYVSDVGTAIDSFIHEHIRELAIDDVERAVSVVEPLDGRYWLGLKDRIYVLSFFPSSKVTAWSYYEPGFDVSDFVRINARLYARGGNTIYLYGGDNGDEFPGDDEMVASVELPFLDAESPSTQKMLSGLDVACVNEWLVKLLPDPNDESRKQTVGRVYQNTYHLPHIPLTGRTTHFALELSCAKAGPASLSSLLVHFTGGEEPR